MQDLLVYQSLLNETPITLKQYEAKIGKDQKVILLRLGQVVEGNQALAAA